MPGPLSRWLRRQALKAAIGFAILGTLSIVVFGDDPQEQAQGFLRKMIVAICETWTTEELEAACTAR